MSNNHLSYRPEIDGLRAIAVLAVIIYHAELVFGGSTWLQGGYLGVDVFFVISGYLIGRIILSEIAATGGFSFKNFYIRRARRLLPALFLVIISSFPFAWKLLYPTAFVEFVQSILSAIFFGSNFFFYFATTEYGAESSLLKPFLHTWSLGVEEQFYIVFPVLLILIFKFARALLIPILIALFLASLVFAQVMSTSNPSLNFFLPFTRFWELLAGSFIAYKEIHSSRPTAHQLSKVLPALGLALICYSIFSFNANTQHPSVHSLIPIIGIVLIMLTASSSDIVGKLLGTRPFVFVGLISYSAYLWHFPLFAFARIYKPELDNLDKTALIGVTLALSVASYYLVEQPFRKRLALPVFFKLTSAKAAMVLVACVAVVLGKGDFDRFKMPEMIKHFELDNQKLKEQTKSVAIKYRKSNLGPYLVENNGRARVLVIGNSHGSDMFRLLLSQDGLSKNKHIMIKNIQLSCFVSDQPEDARRVNEFLNSDLYQKADLIVISSLYRDERTCDKFKSGHETSDVDGVRALLKRVKNDGKKAVLTSRTPSFKDIDKLHVADYYIQGVLKAQIQVDSITALSHQINKAYYTHLDRSDYEPINDKLKTIAEEAGVPYLDKYDYICDDEQKICHGITDSQSKSFYDSSTHFTLSGTEFFGRKAFEKGWFEPLTEQMQEQGVSNAEGQ